MLTDSQSVPGARPSGAEAAEVSLLLPKYQIVSCEAGDVRRKEAEQYVRARFLRTHAAHIATFMPTLLLLIDASNTISAVAGHRSADEESLFLERYLNRPIEECLADATGARAKRAQIVEIGNFAADDPRAARAIMSLMAPYLLARGKVWITFTATVSIRRLLLSLGAPCVELGKADGACVRGGDDQWGNYYARDPRVMAGYLPRARRIPALWGTSRED